MSQSLLFEVFFSTIIAQQGMNELIVAIPSIWGLLFYLARFGGLFFYSKMSQSLLFEVFFSTEVCKLQGMGGGRSQSLLFEVFFSTDPKSGWEGMASDVAIPSIWGLLFYTPSGYKVIVFLTVAIPSIWGLLFYSKASWPIASWPKWCRNPFYLRSSFLQSD